MRKQNEMLYAKIESKMLLLKEEEMKKSMNIESNEEIISLNEKVKEQNDTINVLISN
jgi:hypothetical protein